MASKTSEVAQSDLESPESGEQIEKTSDTSSSKPMVDNGTNKLTVASFLILAVMHI